MEKCSYLYHSAALKHRPPYSTRRSLYRHERTRSGGVYQVHSPVQHCEPVVIYFNSHVSWAVCILIDLSVGLCSKVRARCISEFSAFRLNRGFDPARLPFLSCPRPLCQTLLIITDLLLLPFSLSVSPSVIWWLLNTSYSTNCSIWNLNIFWVPLDWELSWLYNLSIYLLWLYNLSIYNICSCLRKDCILAHSCGSLSSHFNPHRSKIITPSP